MAIVASDHYKSTICRYCSSKKLTKFLSLGNHPPSDSFIPADKVASEKRYPLEVYVCNNCFLVQLLDVVNAHIIFDDYVYLSSTSKALKDHYASLAQRLTTEYNLKENDVVVDIGCNDGVLLHGYAHPQLKRVGVEPSKVAAIAKESGLDVINAFFSEEVSKTILEKYGPAKIITATNVFAHVDDIAAFTKGIPELLSDDGIFVIEAAYLIDLIDQTLFDTIYHEHLCYISLTPMVPFLAKQGLEVFHVERVPFGASGPALRVFAAKPGSHAIQMSVAQLLKEEKQWGVQDLHRYQQYAEKVKKVKQEILTLLTTVKAKGATVGGYGAPAKGNTLLNYLELTSATIDYIAETNQLKIGLVAPGSHIPVISEEVFIQKMPEYALLLSWNYLNFFLEKSEYIKNGGKFIVPLPEPTIVP